MDIHTSVVEAIDEIDAAVFSGDTFVNKANREHLQEMIARWQRGLTELADIEEDLVSQS